MYHNKKYLIKMNLSFFDEGEKTEQPTARKRNQAREEGQVAKSAEIATAFLLIAVFFALKMLMPYMMNTVLSFFLNTYAQISNFNNLYSIEDIMVFFTDVIIVIVITVAPIMLISMLIGFVSNYIQVGWHPTAKPLQPKFSKLSPISGFKRIFSFNSIMELFKSIAKLGIIIFATYNVIKDRIPILMQLSYYDLRDSILFVGDSIIALGITVGAIFIAIALIDYIYQKRKLTKDLKMTKQEIKEEYKSVEGNPLIKGQIKQKMREASMRRMMDDVPSADVIITNPTHYAVCIKYEPGENNVPKVVAKGVDHMAKRIKEVGAEHNIEIVENKPLARALYASVDIGNQIPEELYQSVAEILAYVYRLKNKA